MRGCGRFSRGCGSRGGLVGWRRLESEDGELGCLLDKRRGRREVPGEFRIIIEPPLRACVKNEMSRAAAPEFLEVSDDLRAIERVALVNSVFEKVPALPVRIIEDRRIAIRGRDDEGVSGRRLV